MISKIRDHRFISKELYTLGMCMFMKNASKEWEWL